MFEQILQENHAAVKRLLRKRNIIGPVNQATIKKAFERHGEKFMVELLSIITPDDSSFSNLTTSAQFLENVKYISDQNNQVSEVELESAVNKGGKFWSFWDNLLNKVSDTGKTIGQFKQNSTGMNQFGQATNTQYPQMGQANNTRLIYAGAGFLAVVLVVVLIFAKK